jgi:predicted ATP-binding protein involved in virulence
MLLVVKTEFWCQDTRLSKKICLINILGEFSTVKLFRLGIDGKIRRHRGQEVSGTSQSMRIKQLGLKNYRRIKNLELNFDSNQPFAVLVGINGAGKSSILDCINDLVRSYGLIAINNPLKSIFEDRDIRIGESSTCSSVLAVFDDTEINWGVEKVRKEEVSIIENISNNFHQYKLNSFVSVYYTAYRRAIDIQSISNSPRFSLSDNVIINFQGFSSWFQNLENQENETRLSTDINYRDVKLEAARQAIYSMLGEGFSHLLMKRAIYQITIQKDGQEIELSWLSDGEKNLLALASDLARRLAVTYPGSLNPLHEAGLVLIDEIELHLHPAWQRIIIQRLTQTFPGCQFIVTTHSPQVLSNVQHECIHILKVEDGNVVVKRPERSYGRDSNRILEDIMEDYKRPPEIEARILELFRIIHDGELDRAKDLIQDLATEIGIDEPELIRAASTIHRREVIGR